MDGVETEEDGWAKGGAGAVEELWTVGRNFGTWQTEPEAGRRDPEPDRRDPEPDRQDPEPGRRNPEPGRRQEHGSRIFDTRRPERSRERERVRAQDQGRTGGTDCSFHYSKAQPDL